MESRNASLFEDVFVDPIFSLDTCIDLRGVTSTQLFICHGFSPFWAQLVFKICVRMSVVHDGASVWFILECRHGPFPSCPHLAIGRK